MRRFVAALLLVLCIGLDRSAIAAPALPATFKALIEKATDVQAHMGACRGEEVFAASFSIDGVSGAYAYFANAEGRIVFSYWSGEIGGPPSEVAFGQVHGDVIPVLKWVKYDPELHGTGPCGMLFPEQA